MKNSPSYWLIDKRDKLVEHWENHDFEVFFTIFMFFTVIPAVYS